MRRNPKLYATVMAAWAIVGVACGGGGRAIAITGAGSSTVFPITEAIAEEYQRERPDVQVPIASTGTGGGFERFCSGETDFSNASRPIEADDEKEGVACAAKGIEWIELQVAVDGLTVVVSKENTWATCLTIAELKKIWEPAAEGTITSWSDVRDGFPNEPLKLFGPGSDSGTFDYFTDEINGEEGAQRTDYGNVGEIDEQIVEGVAGDKGGLGYFGYSYYSNASDQVKALEVDSGDGCVAPTQETVRGNTYTPLSRPLFVYVKRSSLARPEVVAFFEFYLATVNDVIADVGYVALDDEKLAEERAELEAAIG